MQWRSAPRLKQPSAQASRRQTQHCAGIERAQTGLVIANFRKSYAKRNTGDTAGKRHQQIAVLPARARQPSSLSAAHALA
jgi:hypothetical protein